MDKFTEIYNELKELSDEEREKKIKELEPECVCPLCPTYNQCAKEEEENVFCLTNRSEKCITNERGCMCPTCPLANKLGIGVMYNFFCLRGTESEQRKM